MDSRNLTKEQMLEAMGDAVRKSEVERFPQALLTPELKAAILKRAQERRQGMGEQWIMPVAPPKPDPEADVQEVIENRRMNAGMEEQPESPEEREARMVREMRMKMLRDASQTGKIPDYLKKY